MFWLDMVGFCLVPCLLSCCVGLSGIDLYVVMMRVFSGTVVGQLLRPDGHFCGALLDCFGGCILLILIPHDWFVLCAFFAGILYICNTIVRLFSFVIHYYFIVFLFA